MVERYGGVGSCIEPVLLEELLTCKRTINLHLKIWSDGWSDMCEPIEYYLDEFIEPPDWIRKSLQNQIYKKIYLTGYQHLAMIHRESK